MLLLFIFASDGIFVRASSDAVVVDLVRYSEDFLDAR